MKNLILSSLLVFGFLTVSAATYIQDAKGNWHYYDDGCPCVHTFVNNNGVVFHSPGSLGTCCTCCG